MSLAFGLAANRLHHDTPDAALFEWLRTCNPGLRELGLKLHAVGRTHDAIIAQHLSPGEHLLLRYPYGRDGGLMRLVSRVAGGTDGSDTLSGAIYLIDPVDPSSTFPEAHALKRQCVTHGKPFISTLAGAIGWVEVERLHAGLAPSPAAGRWFELESQTAALIAHDAYKQAMLEFAAAHFDTLSRFARRVATGTTGRRLNELAWSRGWPQGEPWCDPFLSGPLGGDAQIAELVLDRRCQRVMFFEDPHVARQHEADIQLLERAVCVVGNEAACATSPAMAGRWAAAMALRAGR